MLKGAKINSHSWLESCIIGWRCKVGRWVSANVYVKTIIGFLVKNAVKSRVETWVTNYVAQCSKGLKSIHICGWIAALLDGDVKLDVG